MTREEEKWIHPLALDAIMGSSLNPNSRWNAAGQPIFTDKAKAVLEAVEETAKRCERCKYSSDCMIPLSGSTLVQVLLLPCPLDPIRRAMKGEKP